MREVYILPREEEYVFYRVPQMPENPSKEEKNDLKYAHETYLKKYIKDNNIDVDTEKTSYGLAEELMKIGISSIIVENREMIVFIPKEISQTQYNWYKNMYAALRRFNIHYAYFEGEEIKLEDPDDEEFHKSNINKFYKNIKSNLKKQKESEKNGYKSNI